MAGIVANNTYPADFIYENLMIEYNIIHSSHLAGIQKLLFLGSSCIYLRLVVQPKLESALLTGILEEANKLLLKSQGSSFAKVILASMGEIVAV